jgi:uncharacterized protein (DUF302 family)
MLKRIPITLTAAGAAAFAATMALVILTVSPASAQEETQASSGSVPGLVEVPSGTGADETFGKLESRLEGVEAVSIVDTVDHQANAESAGLDLRSTRLALFANPMLGTPIIQDSQTAGIDLPQKALVREDASGETKVDYNSVEYLKNRHGITDAGEQRETMSNGLSGLITGAVGSDASAAVTGDASGVQSGEGLVTTESAYGPDETFERLRGAVESNESLKVLASVDHQANAESVDMDLRPTKLLVFGNPEAGTPLMQSAQTTGIDLPQKALVYEDASGKTYLAYNDPSYVAERHGITGSERQLAMISTALKSLATEATEATEADESTGSTQAGELPDTGGVSLLVPAAALILAGSGVLGVLWVRRRSAS